MRAGGRARGGSRSDEVEEGEMPTWIDRLAHPDAVLDRAQRESLRRFSEARVHALEAGN